VIIGSAVLLSLPAEAQSRRVNSLSLSCDQARSMIAQRGAVIMSTGQYTFDRYVDNRSFCERNEFARTDFIPTRDNAKCPVRRCVTITPQRFNR
jgi:hypothetical protein